LRERAYQVFGSQFLESLLEVNNDSEAAPDSFSSLQIARVTGFVSAPRERRTSRDAQFLFVNGRFVRDRLIGRALSEGYRSILPHGVYPVALLFIDVALEEVDVNVHPAKTEVRFRRAAAVADSVREAVRAALASAGFAPPPDVRMSTEFRADEVGPDENKITLTDVAEAETSPRIESGKTDVAPRPGPQQERIGFGFATAAQPQLSREEAAPSLHIAPTPSAPLAAVTVKAAEPLLDESETAAAPAIQPLPPLPPLDSARKFVRQMAADSISSNIRPLGQLEESFIVATDDDGLLLIDQHVAHERVLFDKYRALETSRQSESQRMLLPETFDLTPAQAAAFDGIAAELESYGFELMRLSGRTVAIKATPADLPASEARNCMSEVLDSVDAEKRGKSREVLRDEIAASLACHSAIKVNMPLAPEKMRWLIDRLLLTSSPTTCPHGRPVILRLTTQDILKGFHRI